MTFRTILGLLIVLIVCSCTQQLSKSGLQIESGTDQATNLNTGLKIEYGPDLGMIDTFNTGNYIHITATITNDSVVPIHLNLALSKENDFPDSCGDKRYKIFLLPEELTPGTATLYGGIADGLGGFLDKCLENPYVLDKALESGEYAVIAIGTLFSRDLICSALSRAIFTQSEGYNIQACDSRMNQDESTNPQLSLGVKLDFNSGKSSNPETCILFPFGQIYYP